MNILVVATFCVFFVITQSKTIDHYKNDVFQNPTDDNDDLYQDVDFVVNSVADDEDEIFEELEDLDSQGVGHLVYNGDENMDPTKRISTSTTSTETTPTTTNTTKITPITESIPTTAIEILVTTSDEPKASTENIPKTIEPDQTSENIQSSSTDEISVTTSENIQSTDNAETTEDIATMVTDISTKEPRMTEETLTTKPTRETTTHGKIRKQKLSAIIRILLVKMKAMERKQRTLGAIVMKLNTRLVRLVLKTKMKKISL